MTRVTTIGAEAQRFLNVPLFQGQRRQCSETFHY
jgi:hypothetical protein